MFGLVRKIEFNELEKRLAFLERKTDAIYNSMKNSIKEMQRIYGVNEDTIHSFSYVSVPLGAFEVNEEFNGTDKDDGLLQQDLTNYK